MPHTPDSSARPSRSARGGPAGEYAHARVIHHPDDSVSVVALDELGDQILTKADAALRAKHDHGQ
jgi:hypothetical protein